MILEKQEHIRDNPPAANISNASNAYGAQHDFAQFHMVYILEFMKLPNIVITITVNSCFLWTLLMPVLINIHVRVLLVNSSPETKSLTSIKNKIIVAHAQYMYHQRLMESTLNEGKGQFGPYTIPAQNTPC